MYLLMIKHINPQITIIQYMLHRVPTHSDIKFLDISLIFPGPRAVEQNLYLQNYGLSTNFTTVSLE